MSYIRIDSTAPSKYGYYDRWLHTYIPYKSEYMKAGYIICERKNGKPCSCPICEALKMEEEEKVDRFEILDLR